MLRTIVTNLRQQQWGQAIFELLIVAVGIIMAFQVDRWWEERKDRISEQEYIERFIADIERDIEQLEYGISLAEFRLSLASLLIEVAENPVRALESPVQFIIAVNQAAYTFTPALSSNTFDELRSTGNLGLIRDGDLKNSLFDYYRFDESQRQYLSLQIMQEFRHFELVAGVLSNQQTLRAEDDWGIVNPEEFADFRNAVVDAAEVRAAAERLAQDAELVAWLPIAYVMQRELVSVHRERLARARMLLGTLNQAI